MPCIYYSLLKVYFNGIKLFYINIIYLIDVLKKRKDAGNLFYEVNL